MRDQMAEAGGDAGMFDRWREEHLEMLRAGTMDADAEHAPPKQP